jgi:hypothetical protein
MGSAVFAHFLTTGKVNNHLHQLPKAAMAMLHLDRTVGFVREAPHVAVVMPVLLECIFDCVSE